MVTRNFQRCLDGRPFAQRVARRGGRPSRAFDDVRLLMFFGWERRFARVSLCSLAAKGRGLHGLEVRQRRRGGSARDEEESDDELHFVVLIAVLLAIMGRSGRKARVVEKREMGSERAKSE